MSGSSAHVTATGQARQPRHRMSGLKIEAGLVDVSHGRKVAEVWSRHLLEHLLTEAGSPGVVIRS